MTLRFLALALLTLLLGCPDGPTPPGGTADVGDAGLDAPPDVQTFCQPGARQCLDIVVAQRCADDGSEWIDEECTGELRCNDQDGTCSPEICTPGAFDS